MVETHPQWNALAIMELVPDHTTVSVRLYENKTQRYNGEVFLNHELQCLFIAQGDDYSRRGVYRRTVGKRA